MLPKVMMLDLDDTIVSYHANSEITWVLVCNEFCIRRNIIEPGKLLKAIDEYRKWYWSDRERHRIGRNDMHAARRVIVAGAFEKLGIYNRDYAAEIADNYTTMRLETLELFPKSLDTLESLRQNDIRLALLTNGDSNSQRFKIKKFDLEKYFEIILVEGELGFGKPDRRVYEKAMAELGVTPQDAWMAGDNLEWDVKGAQELGIYGVWVDYRKQGLPVESEIIPDRIIYNISELL